MAAGVARRPSGKVSVVYSRDKEREGAYDFLESRQVTVDQLTESMCAATVARAAAEATVYVIVDATHLKIADDAATKGFGPIGSPNVPARGLMAMNALAVSKSGTPLGLVDQQFWARKETLRMTPVERAAWNKTRPFEDKQQYRFATAAENAAKRLSASGINSWIVIDREGDNSAILARLGKTFLPFTIRSKWDRRVFGEDFERIRQNLLAQPPVAARKAAIARNGNRAARTATLTVRSMKVQIDLRNRSAELGVSSLTLHAVLVREYGTAARRKDAIDWLLLTNVPVESADDAQAVVDSYRARWRIEEFHRTWKQGHCNVEDAQLRTPNAMMKWATLLAAAATRIERLKYLSRSEPDLPASVELDATEIEALRVAYRSHLRDNGAKRLPASRRPPTIGEATVWIAKLGGWLGEKRSGLPGSVSIARGLDKLAIYTQALEDLRAEAGERATT